MDTVMVPSEADTDQIQKLYPISERYCALRVKGFEPQQAYRIAKGIQTNEEVPLRTIQHQEQRYKKLALDVRRLPEIKIEAAKAYLKILKGKGRSIEKITKDGDVVEYKEKPPFSVMADLAKDTLEHNNPTIKRSESLVLTADLSPVDLDKYRNKCKDNDNVDK